jgi:hypothetical protein
MTFCLLEFGATLASISSLADYAASPAVTVCSRSDAGLSDMKVTLTKWNSPGARIGFMQSA